MLSVHGEYMLKPHVVGAVEVAPHTSPLFLGNEDFLQNGKGEKESYTFFVLEEKKC